MQHLDTKPGKKMQRLKDKVAIVTGGARGLGKAFCLAMAQEGSLIVVADILDTDARAVASEIVERGGAAIAVKADVTSEEDMTMIVEKAVQAYGRIDILVNNAAMVYGIKRRAFTDIPASEWDRMMSVSVGGAFFCSKAVFPHMREQGKGKIVNISSETAFTGSKGFLHYVTAKGALISFTRALAAEAGQYGICVNCLAPGFTDTEAARTLTSDIDKYDVSLTPLKRLGQPEDMIGAILFLCSDESDFVTGQTLVVNGGRYMN